MFTVTAFGHLVDGLRNIHTRHRTERILRDLPSHTRRDIGLEELPPIPRRVRPLRPGQ
jgi:hypothetical protein